MKRFCKNFAIAIRAFIEKYLREWAALGGETFLYFTLTSPYSKRGSWGLLENVTDESSPKYDVVLGVLRKS